MTGCERRRRSPRIAADSSKESRSAGAVAGRSDGDVADGVRDLDQLAARPLVRLEHRRVELDVEALERAAHARGTRADDDDIALLVSVEPHRRTS